MKQKSHSLLSQNVDPPEHNLAVGENIRCNTSILLRGKSCVLPTDALFTLQIAHTHIRD